MQLRRLLYLILLAPFTLKPFIAKAQASRIKVKKLHYDETNPGITVNEESIELLLELESQDQINFMYLHDAITGASPTGIEQTSDTQTSASGSSITARGRGQSYADFRDERHAFTLGYNHLFTSDWSVKGELVYSTENDYISKGAGLSTELLLNQKNTTLDFSVKRNDDEIKHKSGSKTDTNYKKVNAYSTAISQLLSPRQIAGLGMSYGESLGYHTDDYKQVKIGSQIKPEKRPDARYFFSYSGDYKLQFADNHSIKLLFGRYQDSWEIQSYHLSAESFHQLSKSFILSFYLRYYNQNGAYFWKAKFTEGENPKYHSSDIRLSPFSANTYSFTLYYQLNDNMTLEGSYGLYKQYDGGLALLAENNLTKNNLPKFDSDDDDDDEGYGGKKSGTSVITQANIVSVAFEYRF